MASTAQVTPRKPAPVKGVLKAVLPPSMPGPATYTATCTPEDLLAVKALTFSQRACLYRSRMFSKSFPIRAALFSAYSELQSDDIENPGFGSFGHRFAAYYARRTAQNTGEFLAGYWHHEDPRYRPSLEHGVWKRSRSALLSVLIARDADGGNRMAFAPITGAFGSGMVSAVCYRNQNTIEDGLRRSGTSYSLYFATALVRGFKPELNRLVARVAHRH